MSLAAVARLLDPRIRGDDESRCLQDHRVRRAELRSARETERSAHQPVPSPPRRACPREGGDGSPDQTAAVARSEPVEKQNTCDPTDRRPRGGGGPVSLAAVARLLDPRIRGDDESRCLQDHRVRRAELRSARETERSAHQPVPSPPRRACPREGGDGSPDQTAAVARSEPVEKQNTCDPTDRRPRGGGGPVSLAAVARLLDPRIRGDDESRCLQDHRVRRTGLRSVREIERSAHQPVPSPPRRRGPSVACRSRTSPGSPPPPSRGQALRGDDESRCLQDHRARRAGLRSSQETDRLPAHS